jgi:D-3-phosphoglycerate dehydrogenase
VLITDVEYRDNELERSVLESAGVGVELAQCRTPEEVIRAGRGANALLVQYAPITREILEALPSVRIISRYGVGVDNFDLEAAKELGIWAANVPDYGMGKAATHALAMALALVRRS